MIRFVKGDILASDAEALVNTVNCVGVMGRGIALQFKNLYPTNYKVYKAACDRGEVKPGQMHVFETGMITSPRFIINFPTKRHWRGKSRMEDIEAGLAALISEIHARGIRSIAIPPLGSGLGGLDWTQVRPRIEQAMTDVPNVEVVVYEPGGASADGRANRSKDVPNMTAGRAALVVLMHRYLAGFMDTTITLLEVHKLLYFLQTGGEKLRLQYAKGPYGPYAENLRHVLRAVEGHLVSGYADGGDAPEKPLKIVPGAVEDAEKFLNAYPETHERFLRVGALVDGFETPFGLELLATVHWVVTMQSARDPEAVVQQVHNWSPRKKQFSPRQINLALHRLDGLGWLSQ